MDNDDVLLLERDAQSWRLRCDSSPELVSQANAYLGYLADRNYLTALTEIPQFCSSKFLTLGRSAA